MSLEQARAIVKKRIYDIEMILTGFRSFWPPTVQICGQSSKLSISFRKVRLLLSFFPMARCNISPLAVVEVSYKKVPMSERLCSCGISKIEITEHTLLNCEFYEEIKDPSAYI